MARVGFDCPTCTQRLTTEPEDLREPVRCARCGTTFTPLDALDLDEPLPAIVVKTASAPPPRPAPREEPPIRESEPAGAEDPPDSSTPARRARGGTVVMDSPAKEAAPGSGPTGESGTKAARPRGDTAQALRAMALAFLDALGRRIPARHAVAITVLAPAAAMGLLVVLAIADGAALRWTAGVIAFVVLTPVLAAALAALATRAIAPPPLGRGAPPRPAPTSLRAGAGVLVAALAALVTAGVARLSAPVVAGSPEPRTAGLPASATSAPSATAAPTAMADAKLERGKDVPVGSGVLRVPDDFRSEDGSFDLVMHFAGNAALVEESVAAARINALVHVSNIGEGSGSYRERFQVPGGLEMQLAQITEQAEKLGLKNAKLRRLALSSWSVGYGAVSQILSMSRNPDKIDAVLLMEGVHAGFADRDKRRVDPNRIDPLVRFARLAADGRKLFAISHSFIQTEDYADSAKVADAIIDKLGAKREPAGAGAAALPKIDLPAAAAVAGKEPPLSLEPHSSVHVNGFHVLGYAGSTGAHYRAHLRHMSVTVLPLLAARWK